MLLRNDRPSWLNVIWDALHAYREDCIPEGEAIYDTQWDDICTAMSWVSEDLGVDLNSDGDLVATAPDLIDVVLEAEDALSDSGQYPLTLRRLRKAIAKAKGEA